jgi:hypothetical protein
MENNVACVRESTELRQGAQALVDRAVEMERGLLTSGKVVIQTERGGRKANPV